MVNMLSHLHFMATVGKFFRVSFRFDSGFIHDECDRIIDEDYATRRWALQRLNDYKKTKEKLLLFLKRNLIQEKLKGEGPLFCGELMKWKGK